MQDVAHLRVWKNKREEADASNGGEAALLSRWNSYYLDEKELVFRRYKTSKTYGIQKFILTPEASPWLEQLITAVRPDGGGLPRITAWLTAKFEHRDAGEYLTGYTPRAAVGNRQSIDRLRENAVSQQFLKETKNIGITTFRHFWASVFSKETKSLRSQLQLWMAHSPGVCQGTYVAEDAPPLPDDDASAADENS